jgi:hypothetical protein
MSMRRLGALAAILLSAGRVAAQTSDPVFTQWTWNPDVRGPRVTGLAGAYVTTAEGGVAITLSPACLSFTDGREASFSVGRQPSLSFVQRMNEWLVVGAHLGRTLQRQIAATGVEVNPSGTIDSGTVDFHADTVTLGAAVERRWGREDRNGLTFGLALAQSKLGVGGTYSVYRPETREEIRVALDNGSGLDPFQGTLAASLVYERGHRYTDRGLRLGVAVRKVPLWPAAWHAERSALRLDDGAIAETAPPTTFRFREPLTASAATEGRLGRFLLVGQVDWTDYADVLRSLGDNSTDGGQFHFGSSGVDWSAAVEARVLEAVQVRVGYRRQRPHRFDQGDFRQGDTGTVTGGLTWRKDLLGKLVHVDFDWWRDVTFTDLSIGVALEF